LKRKPKVVKKKFRKVTKTEKMKLKKEKIRNLFKLEYFLKKNEINHILNTKTKQIMKKIKTK